MDPTEIEIAAVAADDVASDTEDVPQADAIGLILFFFFFPVG